MRKRVLWFVALIIMGVSILGIYLIKNREKPSEVAVVQVEQEKIIVNRNSERVQKTEEEKWVNDDRKEIASETKKKKKDEGKVSPVMSYNYESGEKIVDGTYKNDGKKVAFLTFDDGPSTNITPKILDYLKEKKIKATFFVLGKNIEGDEEIKSILKRMIQEGHVIGNHTYSHDYKKLYPNENTDIKAFMYEVDKTNEAIKNAVGKDYKIALLRMPYGYITRVHSGDKNLAVLKSELKKREMHSLDWNCLTEDAVGKEKTPDELLEFLKRSAGNKEKLLILMHDSRGRNNTYEGLPKIVEYLQSKGYEFAVFNDKD